MKRATHEVARELGLHPANLLLHIAQLGAPLDEVWPTIDEAWIETLRASDWTKWRTKPDKVDLQASEELPLRQTRPEPVGIAPDLAIVVEKLWRKNKWGSVSVTFEALQNLTHLPSDKLHLAVHELREKGLLLATRNAYSLNSARKGDIEHIATVMVRRGSTT